MDTKSCLPGKHLAMESHALWISHYGYCGGRYEPFGKVRRQGFRGILGSYPLTTYIYHLASYQYPLWESEGLLR